MNFTEHKQASCFHQSIHFLRLIRGQVVGAADLAGKRRLPSPQPLRALLGDPKAVPGQLGDIVSPACSGSSRGPGWLSFSRYLEGRAQTPCGGNSFSHPESNSFGYNVQLVTIGDGHRLTGKLRPSPICSASSPAWNTYIESTSKEALHQSACQSPAPYCPPSWTRAQDTWVAPLG